MRDQENVRSTFTLIYHDVRIELDLNLLEYVILDTVFYLSQNAKGYCFKSIRALARDLGMSPEGIRTAIARLVKRELLLPYRNGYKTCDMFIRTVHLKTDRKTVTYRSGVQKTDTYRSTDRKVGVNDRKMVTSVRKVGSQQMLDIQENNIRNTYGSPREDTRELQKTKPKSAAIIKFEERIEQIRSSRPVSSDQTAS